MVSFNETTFENEEKELVMAFNILTLKYKDNRLEETLLKKIDVVDEKLN